MNKVVCQRLSLIAGLLTAGSSNKFYYVDSKEK